VSRDSGQLKYAFLLLYFILLGIYVSAYFTDVITKLIKLK